MLRLRASVQQRRDDRDAVAPFRSDSPGQFHGGWQDILKAPHVGAPGACCDPPRPARDHRHPDAALVEVALGSPQGTAAIEVVRPARRSRSIVRREEHDRVVVEAQISDQLQDAPDVSVEPRDHRRQRGVSVLGPDQPSGAASAPWRLEFLELPAVLRVDFVIWNDVLGVRDRERCVAKERTILVVANELERSIGNHVVRVRAPTVALVAFERQLLIVVVDVMRVEVVGVGLVEVAHELVEALLPRHAVRADVSEAPLAEAARRVALLLEQLRDGHVLREDRHAAGVRANRGVSHVHPGHQDAPRGSANGAARIGVREDHALGRHAIDVRSEDLVLAVAAELAVAEVVGHDEHDVWRAGGGGLLGWWAAAR